MQKTISLNRIYQLVILALILILLWKWHCGSPACPPITESVKRDTTIIYKADSSAWTKPTPVSERPGKVPTVRPQITHTPGVAKPDTVWLPVDTAAILADHYTVRDYDTAYQFAEGEIRVQNTVSENTLFSQRVLPTFHIPEITTTITQAEKKRGQLYLGIEGYGGREFPLYGAGASLMYKTKRDKVYEVGPVVFKDQQVMLKAGVKFLISFRN
jgi:hypothetical protein